MDGSFFIHFAICSIISSVAMFLILLVKKALKKHITTRWQYNMDLLYFVLLAVPFIPSGLFSLNSGNWLNVLRSAGEAAANINTAADEGNQVMYGSGWLQDFTLSVNRSTPEYLPVIFMGIWIVGIIVFTLITYRCNRNLRLVKESMKPAENVEILSLITRCKTELGIKKNIRVGTSVIVKTPITFGILKTYIILPAENMTQTMHALLCFMN